MNLQIDRNSANHCSLAMKQDAAVDLSTGLGISCSIELATAGLSICRCCCCCIGQITMMMVFCRSIDLASIVRSSGLKVVSTENRGLIQTAVVKVQIDHQISLSMGFDYIDR